MSSTGTPLISIDGKAFVDSSQNRFVVRGVALSAAGVAALKIDDILSDEHHTLMVSEIIPKLTDLNVNCIRVYQVNPSNTHGKTMKILESKGIYVMVGLATTHHSVKQMTGEYSYETFLHASQVVDEFQNYANTLCFSVGNEVEFPGQQATNLNTASPGTLPAEIIQQTIALELNVAQAMKSFARDIKAHIAAKSYRAIPVGAAMQDGPQTSWENTALAYQSGIIGTDIIAQYYADGILTERMDFIGINSYRYQSGTTGLSAYDGLGTECTNLPVPAFLTETGAIPIQPIQPAPPASPLPPVARTWAIVPEMYSDANVYPQLSGQIAFQLLEEGAGFGLYDVSVNGGIVTLTASVIGGAAALGTEFATAAALPLPLNPASATPSGTTTAPTTFGNEPTVTVTWPASLRAPYLAPNAQITVSNYASNVVQIIQLGAVCGTVQPAVNSTTPTSQTINVCSGTALSIQAQSGTSWDALCGVAAANVMAGITVETNVTWSTSAGCNVNLGTNNPITINVNNYETSEVNVVVDGTVVTKVPAGTATVPVNQNISLSSIGQLNFQTLAYDQICSVSAMLIQDNITIDNNVTWGMACSLPVSSTNN